MYRHCIYCSAELGVGTALGEYGPGRTLAFEAGADRVWVVCRRCNRWGLLPREAGSEVRGRLDTAFAGARRGECSEHVEQAVAADGTRLIRIGPASEAEIALWRYTGYNGRHAVSRSERNEFWFWAILIGCLGGAVLLSQLPQPWGLLWVAPTLGLIAATLYGATALEHGAALSHTGGNAHALVVGAKHMAGARLVSTAGEVGLLLPGLRALRPEIREPVLLQGTRMLHLLLRYLPRKSAAGYGHHRVLDTTPRLKPTRGDSPIVKLAREERELQLTKNSRYLAATESELFALELTLTRELEADDGLLMDFWAEAEVLAGLKPTRRKSA